MRIEELNTMDSYVVRIYRRDRGKPQNFVGLVEIVASQEERPFANFEELQSILSKVGKGSGAKQKICCAETKSQKK